jgi:glycerol-3-phosphate dehydrogenase
MSGPDVVIVGGGMQGATMALAAARKGLKPLIVERDRVASGATGNSYGFVHGGLRYLQTMDLRRWRRSRRAQSWFLENYPDHVRPLACVMPLYRGRMRSPTAFRLAAAMEAWLARTAGCTHALPGPGLIAPGEVSADFPIPRRHLTGAAVWHDLVVPDMRALLLTILSDAGVTGSALMERTEARELIVKDNRVAGLRVARDNGAIEEITTSNVAICAGSWSAPWRRDGETGTTAVLAFNLLLDIPFPPDTAVAVSEQPGRGRSYFLRPQSGGTLAGTFYRPAPGASEPEVSDGDVQAFRAALARALPGSEFAAAPVRAVMAGLLPDRDGTGRSLSASDTISLSGPSGLCRILGTKLTTAPLLSFEAAERMWPAEARRAA